MRQSQLAGAVLALAAMVFVVSFAMNYLGGGPPRPAVLPAEPSSLPPARELTFRSLTAPEALPEPEKSRGKGRRPLPYETVLECEGAAGGGHADFWFVNDNAEPLTVGLDRKNCTCASVALFVPPPALQPAGCLLAVEGYAPVFHGPGLLPALCARAAAPLALAARTPAADLLIGKDTTEVPAGAVGWLRLGWKGEKTGRQNLQATVWMDRRERGATTTLETHVLFHEALLVRPEVSAGVVREEELDGETGHRVTMLVWSATRQSLRLTAKAVGSRKPESDPFVVGAPEPMTGGEMLALEREINQEEKGDPARAGRVLCGYRVPVTLRRLSPDGTTPFDLGVFRRVVTVSSDDEGVKPVEVAVQGRVRGAVSLVSDDEGGGVNLSDFPAARGRRVTVELRTEGPDLELTFDRERTPAYLAASFPTPPQGVGGGYRLWAMRVEALPDRARGRFPRADGEYRDSAVYLKATQPGRPPRAVRVPVSGTGVGG